MSNKITHKSLLTLSVMSGMLSIAFAAETKTQELNQLETIVVIASGFEQDIKKAAASISVLSQEEINKKLIVMSQMH